MTTPPPPYRVLQRSRNDRFVGGVCGGLASYLNMDPTLVRVLTVVLSLFTGVPIVLYLIALFVIPEEDDARRPGPPPVGGPPTNQPYPYPYQSGPPAAEPDYAPYPGQAAPHQYGPRQYGPPPAGSGGPTAGDDALWGPAGAPWQQPPGPAPTRPPADSDGPAPGAPRL